MAKSPITQGGQGEKHEIGLGQGYKNLVQEQADHIIHITWKVTVLAVTCPMTRAPENQTWSVSVHACKLAPGEHWEAEDCTMQAGKESLCLPRS